MRSEKNISTTMDLSEDCSVVLTGIFTPYDYGVRYHRDGSGTPPTPEEFDINKVECDNIIELIEEIDNFYDDKRQTIVETVKNIVNAFINDNFREWVERNETFASKIEELHKKIRFNISLGDSFLDDISYKAAEKLQQEYNIEAADHDY